MLQSSVLIHNLGHGLLTVMDLSRFGPAGGLFQSIKSDQFLTIFLEQIDYKFKVVLNLKTGIFPLKGNG